MTGEENPKSLRGSEMRTGRIKWCLKSDFERWCNVDEIMIWVLSECWSLEPLSLLTWATWGRDKVTLDSRNFQLFSAGNIHHVMWSFLAKICPKMPKNISLDDVLEPLKQAFLASRDVIISSQICVSKLQRVFTLGDGCWLPIFWLRLTFWTPSK